MGEHDFQSPIRSETADIMIIFILNFLSDFRGTEHKTNLQIAKV